MGHREKPFGSFRRSGHYVRIIARRVSQCLNMSPTCLLLPPAHISRWASDGERRSTPKLLPDSPRLGQMGCFISFAIRHHSRDVSRWFLNSACIAFALRSSQRPKQAPSASALLRQIIFNAELTKIVILTNGAHLLIQARFSNSVFKPVWLKQSR